MLKSHQIGEGNIPSHKACIILRYSGEGGGDPTFAPATIDPTMISQTTKSQSEGNDWVFGSR